MTTGRSPSVVAGIRLPDSGVAAAAEQLSRQVSDRMLYGHAVRSYLFAALLARSDGLSVDDEALYVACVLHDVGLTQSYEDPVRAFEHVSADVAVDLIGAFGWQPERRSNVHRAIVLHMAEEVAESESPEARALEAGVALDVTGSRFADVDERACEEIFRHFPRGAFKRDFAALLLREAERKPDSAAAALANRGLLDRIHGARFEDTE